MSSKISDTGYDYVQTSVGPADMQWLGIRPSGNGVKLRLKVGNMTMAGWEKFQLIGSFGKLDEGGNPDEGTAKSPFAYCGAINSSSQLESLRSSTRWP